MEGLRKSGEKAGEAGRRSFVKDVLSLEMWAAPVPGIKETKEGLEYLSEPGKKGTGRPPQPFTISTRPANGKEHAPPPGTAPR